jgi:hypothetical protein
MVVKWSIDCCLVVFLFEAHSKGLLVFVHKNTFYDSCV